MAASATDSSREGLLAQGSEAAAKGSEAAKQVASDMKDMFNIQQGPMFLRALALLTSLASFGCVIFLLINPATALFHPVWYILYVYIAVFALTSLLFEAKTEWIQNLGPLARYQEMLTVNCHFLTILGGRGLFYIFQATLWLTFAGDFTEILEIAAAGALGLVGLLHLLAHFGMEPHTVNLKMIHHAETLLNKDLDGDGKVGKANP
eukprot:TRINITY_DN8266_c1_g1_i2.p1 TRINITY_DN8266_c1_g1~~TRINITY_DN8266_c1_g1_i2.p1  ORF type:complete len:206 (-),score=40.65 TRINITY_DN8266_c1_g1_i2:114-731(-)